MKKMDFALIVLFAAAIGLATYLASNASIQYCKEKESRAYLAGTVRDIDTALMVYCHSQINNLEAIKYFTSNLQVLKQFSITCTTRTDPAAEIYAEHFLTTQGFIPKHLT